MLLFKHAFIDVRMLKEGQSIRYYRQKAGYSLSDLARLSHVSPDYLWRIERGLATNVGLNKLKAISQALDVSIHSIIKDSEPSEEIKKKTLQQGKVNCHDSTSDCQRGC